MGEYASSSGIIRELTHTLMKHKVQNPQVALPRLEELAIRLDAMDDPALVLRKRYDTHWPPRHWCGKEMPWTG